MNLEKTLVHEIHEKTRTKPKSSIFMMFNPMGESPNENNPLLFFVSFMLFVDELRFLG